MALDIINWHYLRFLHEAALLQFTMTSPANNFMTFNLDHKINCIQKFSQNFIFIATSKDIILYDLSQAKQITQCEHQTNRKKIVEDKDNNDNNKASQNKQDQKQSKNNENCDFSPLEMHFYPQKTHENISKSKQQRKIGNIIVHYKMTGIGIYRLVTISQENKYCIEFIKFTPINFGSAFLPFSFQSPIFNRQQINPIKIPQDQSSNFVDQYLQNLQKYQTLNLGEEKESPLYFYILTSQNEMFNVKRIRFDKQSEQIQTLQSYQIDQQSTNINNSTVTLIKQYKIVGQKQSKTFLIMAIQGFFLLLFQLPQSQKLSQNQQYYLEPAKKINLMQCFKSQFKQEQKTQSITAENFYVTQIELIDEGLALINIRSVGLLLIELKSFKIISRVQLKINKNKTYFFSDLRLMQILTTSKNIQETKYNSQLTQQQSQTSKISQTTSQTKSIKTSLITLKLLTSTLTKLNHLQLQIKLFKQLTLKQQQCQTKFSSQFSTKVTKIKMIEQLNTNKINDIIVVKNNYDFRNNTRQQEKYYTIKHQKSQIQVFGHFQHGKIFYFNNF